MSLFRTCDWWRAAGGGSEEAEFQPASLVVDCLAGEGSDSDHAQVVVTSLAGLVQIWQPVRRPGGDSRAEDLLLEQQLPAPVLATTRQRKTPQQDWSHRAVGASKSVILCWQSGVGLAGLAWC